MSSTKIIYGIDLGTTNSAITRFENGKAVVKKNAMQSDTTPSCVAYNRLGKVLVGAKARQQLGKDYINAFKNPDYKSNTFIEFKRLMGTDHAYECVNLARQLTPEELSSEVLKELRRYVLDDNVQAAVITVPAMFNNTQKDATKRAAKLAGFDHVELIQEPVAASIAYGLEAKMKNAYWVVFDFGGGTFDAALMKIQDGIMQAIDTDGNNKLGGKDIDRAIIEEIIFPYLERNYNLSYTLNDKRQQFLNMWKAKAEEAKIALSFNPSVDIETDLGEDYGTDDDGQPLELALNITQDELERISAPIFQRAIDITKKLLQRNNISGDDLGALILVGGPTHSPVIRKMLRDQITSHVDTSIDPMTCVAEGAAIYGSTIDLPEEVANSVRDTSKVQLQVNYQSTSVETEEWVSVALMKEKSANLISASVNVEFARADGMFTTPLTKIDVDGDVVSLALAPDKTNVFDIRCYDDHGTRLECEPIQISIIQGIAGLGNAVMPMAIGLGTLNAEGVEMFDPVNGLEKSRKLPALGYIRNLKTPKDIRPGVTNDELRMSLYQIEDAAVGTRALYCQRVYDIFLNGDDLSEMLPAGSVINVKMHAEQSGTIDKFELEIPMLNTTVDLTERITNSKTTAPSTVYILREMADAKQRAHDLQNTALQNRINVLEQRFNQPDQDRDLADATLSDLQAICREIDHEYAMGAWERQETKLRGMMAELEKDNDKYGNEETTILVKRLKTNMENVIAKRNVQLGKDLYNQMWSLDFRIAEVEFYIAWIFEWNRDFSQKRWTNPSRARELINMGLQIINQQPTAFELKPIAMELSQLLPENQRPDVLIH